MGSNASKASALAGAVTPKSGRATILRMHDLVFESTRTVTQTEFAEFCWARTQARDLAHHELLHGRIVMSPPAGYPHGEVEARVALAIGAFVREHGPGKVLGSSQGFELPTGDTVEPDCSFVSNERWGTAPPPEAGRFLRVVPDLAVEILSASNATYDRGEKKGIYERAGVRELWIIDPNARLVLVFVLDGGRYGTERVFGEGDRVASGVLSGLVVEVEELFPSG
jgi:Uma2 family endonuclease